MASTAQWRTKQSVTGSHAKSCQTVPNQFPFAYCEPSGYVQWCPLVSPVPYLHFLVNFANNSNVSAEMWLVMQNKGMKAKNRSNYWMTATIEQCMTCLSAIAKHVTQIRSQPKTAWLQYRGPENYWLRVNYNYWTNGAQSLSNGIATTLSRNSMSSMSLLLLIILNNYHLS